MAINPKRREIARHNINACLTYLSQDERDALVRAHFEALGIGALEMALCWWGTDERLRSLADPVGLEHLETALSRGKGVILLSAHFTCLEMGARLLCLYTPLHVMYRKNENPFWDEVLYRGRSGPAEHVFSRQDVRALIRSLRNNKAVWFAPDQVPKERKDAALVPFFGEPAVTNTATSRIARITGAAVVPYFPRRMPDGRYRMSFGAPLEGFPSGDPAQDALVFNRLVEEQVRKAPEQYFWIHRRFKARPPEYADLYQGV